MVRISKDMRLFFKNATKLRLLLFIIFFSLLVLFVIVKYEVPKFMFRHLIFRKKIFCENKSPANCDRSFCVVLDKLYKDTSGSDIKKLNVAIGMAITLKGKTIKNLDRLVDSKIIFFDTFLPSFCQTISEKEFFAYSFYLAYDYNDVHLWDCWTRHRFTLAFELVVKKHCVGIAIPRLKMIECAYSGNPAWSQNDAMVEAYLDGVDYFYRVNDDTLFRSSGWTTAFISTFLDAPLPNVGVLGPRHTGGAEDIMTYDFVHRSHVDIFGFHYPRQFKQWYADTWISFVYRCDNKNYDAKNFKCGTSKFVEKVKLTHTISEGRRYDRFEISDEEKFKKINRDRQIFIRYLMYRNSAVTIKSDSRRIIILMAGPSSSPAVWWGCLRNSLTRPLYFPSWEIKLLYNLKDVSKNGVRERVLRILGGVDHVHMVETDDVWIDAFNILVDMRYSYVLLRSCTGRLSDRDREITESWISKNQAASNSIKPPNNNTLVNDLSKNIVIIIPDAPNISNNTAINSNSKNFTSSNHSKNATGNSESFPIVLGNNTTTKLMNYNPKENKETAVLSIKDGPMYPGGITNLSIYTTAFNVKLLSSLINLNSTLTVLKEYSKKDDVPAFFENYLWRQVAPSMEMYDSHICLYNSVDNSKPVMEYMDNYVGRTFNEFEEPYWRLNRTQFVAACR